MNKPIGHRTSARAFFGITLKSALLLSTAIAAAAVVPRTALAQVIEMEEIIVTAQSRAQSVHDTPISLTAVGGDMLQDIVIQKAEDLQKLVPNFTMTETGISTNIFIRGLGSGINQAFEQSVGYYVDGIAYTRAQQTRMPFMDLERVEVLRGPQTILFGKNSIAGALNIVTAQPTKSFEGYLTGTYEFENQEYIAEGAVSGPITDTVRARVAARWRDSDGYVRNLTLSRTEPKRDDLTLRGIIEADVSDTVVANFKAEYSDFDVMGRSIEILNERPAAAGPFAGRTYAQILVGGFGADRSVLNNVMDGNRSSNGDFSNNRQETYVGNIKVDIGGYELRSITGYAGLKYDELCDCDYTGANVFLAGLREDYDQFSQEFRLTSPVNESYDFVAGAYYQTSKHDYSDNILVQSTSVLVPLINSQSPGAGSAMAGTQAARNASVDSDLWSAFAQVNVRPFGDQLEFQLGARVSTETKEGNRTLTILRENGDPLPAQQAAAAAVYAQVFRVSSTNLSSLGPTGAFLIGQLGSLPVSGERKETRFSPDLKIVYTASEDVMLYGSYARGAKSGGFDFRANNRNFYPTMQDSFEFEDESANSFEVGTKATLGAAQVSVAAFYTEFKDLQISIFDGILGFNVGNAASARSQGIEADGRVRLSEYISLTGSVALTDFKFKDFRNGQCYFGQTPNVDLNGDGRAELCDYTGQTNQLVSDVQGTVGLAANYPVFSGYRLDGAFDVFFTSKYHASNTFDPDLIQKGYATLGVRLGIGPDTGLWQVAFIGRNLTNERYIQFGGDTPLSGSTFGVNSDYAFADRGRTLAIQARVNF
jgi:outer membrane receptor protein involved in Fe transport